MLHRSLDFFNSVLKETKFELFASPHYFFISGQLNLLFFLFYLEIVGQLRCYHHPVSSGTVKKRFSCVAVHIFYTVSKGDKDPFSLSTIDFKALQFCTVASLRY